MRNRIVVLATAVGLVVAASAQAGHHLWDFTEMYSNASGSVQFVEMFTAVNGEAGVGPWSEPTSTAGWSASSVVLWAWSISCMAP